MMVREPTPMEKHFIKWYDATTQGFFYKLHTILRPYCKRCKRDKELYDELKCVLSGESVVEEKR